MIWSFAVLWLFVPCSVCDTSSQPSELIEEPMDIVVIVTDTAMAALVFGDEAYASQWKFIKEILPKQFRIENNYVHVGVVVCGAEDPKTNETDTKILVNLTGDKTILQKIEPTKWNLEILQNSTNPIVKPADALRLAMTQMFQPDDTRYAQKILIYFYFGELLPMEENDEYKLNWRQDMFDHIDAFAKIVEIYIIENLNLTILENFNLTILENFNLSRVRAYEDDLINLAAGDLDNIYEWNETGQMVKDIYRRFHICGFNQTCRYSNENQTDCKPDWWQPKADGKPCNANHVFVHPRDPNGFKCSKQDCERFCDKNWPWENRNCHENDRGKVLVNRVGTVPQQHQEALKSCSRKYLLDCTVVNSSKDAPIKLENSSTPTST